MGSFDELIQNYLSAEIGTYLVLLLLLLSGSVYFYTTYSDRVQLEQQSKKFANLLAEYKYLQSRRKARSKTGNTEFDKSPLAYLESKVNQEDVGELTPTGENENDQPSFLLRLESVSTSKIFKLLSTVESDGRLNVSRFTLERIGLEKKRFDATFELSAKTSSSASN